MLKLLTTALTSLFCCQLLVAQTINIIPKPTKIVEKTGSFSITKSTTIVAKTRDELKSAHFLNDYLNNYYGFKLPIKTKSDRGIVIIAGNSGKDGYTLTTDKAGIVIKGNTAPGAFYGMQTLIQLLPVEKSSTLSVPAVVITDAPASQYRGMMIDVSRHFFPVAFVKKYIDYIALHKMNYFHWHLTEDQGWRIEIKKYPNLTQVAAFRNGTIKGRFPGTGNTNERYGGYYTQEQVKEIVKYAADRFITVIPEIEMPGHGSAAIAAYPFLSCFPEVPSYTYFKKAGNMPQNWAGDTTGKQVIQSWGVYDDIFCAGKETTFEFLQNVLDEVLLLFPSKIVHIGGDEAPKTNWEHCPACQKRIKELNLRADAKHKPEHFLQSYFVQRIEKYLNEKGKTLIGWDEILEGGLAPNAWVMSWRGEQGGIEAATQNHNVIMTPNSYVYFDHQQIKKDDSLTITSNGGGFLPVEKVYSWKPMPDALDASKSQYIQGGQANLWTEYITNPAKAEYMIFPRMSALSEALWTPHSKREFEDFNQRLVIQKKRYRLWNANYYGKQ